MLTTFLSRGDVARHAQALGLLRALREAFTQGQMDVAGANERLGEHDGAGPVRWARLSDGPAWAVTVSTPPSPERPQGRATLQLHDARTGALLAVMDALQVMTLRASLVGALAADVLARPDAATVAVLGSGLPASGALKALRLVRSLTRVWMYEPDLVANTEMTLRLQRSLSTSVRGVDTAAEAVAEADLVVLTGEVPLPVDALKPGAHVTVMAPEVVPTAPLPAELLSRARRFADLAAPGLDWLPRSTPLGAVLAGAAPGRQAEEDVTVFVSRAPAVQDLVTAWHVFERARDDEALTRLDLEAQGA